MSMTPFKLEILLHYFARSEQYPRSSAPAVQDAITYLITHDLLERCDETSHLAVDSHKQLYVCHTNGEDITSKIPLGKATPENVKRLSDCLQQLQKLVAPAPKR